MATLNIEGRRVTVDDSFAQLPADQQDAIVQDIASQIGLGQQQSSPQMTAQEQPTQPTGSSMSELSALTTGFSKAPQEDVERNIRINQKSRAGTDSRLGSAGLGGADMASFGFGDELGAGLGATSEYLAALVTGDKPRSYDELLTTMRKQGETAQENNPGSYLAGQAVGALGTGAGLARGGLSLTANAIGRGATLPRVALSSAMEGSIMGGAQGFGSGEALLIVLPMLANQL